MAKRLPRTPLVSAELRLLLQVFDALDVAKNSLLLAERLQRQNDELRASQPPRRHGRRRRRKQQA